ncbi:MAG: PQQ-binding-like beta-propeller repeat protein [Deltaproteobacteria bacterium]|nr:PQQ-binding-like beta-propeller repeat protein [Deltaproteobacteria bacterium]
MPRRAAARSLVFAAAVAASCAPHPARIVDLPPTGPFRTQTGEATHPRCARPERRGPDGAAPRCTVSFRRGTTTMTASPDGTILLIALLDVEPTAWTLPAVAFGHPFAPIPTEEHEPAVGEREGPQALAVSPDGATTLFAVEDRLIRYDLASGAVLGEFEAPGHTGMVNDVVWSPDGAALMIASAGDGKARLLDAATGRVIRTLPVEGRIVELAFDRTGRRGAVGTEIGTIAIVDLSGAKDARPAVLTPSTQEITGLGFLDDTLVVAARDGRVRLFDVASGALVREADLHAATARFALATDGRLAAVSDDRNVVRVMSLPDAVVRHTFAWHQASITALAWGAGPTLLVADNDGELAAWDVVPGSRGER